MSDAEVTPLHAAVGALPIGLLVLDRSGRAAAVNPPAAALGHTVGEYPMRVRDDEMGGELAAAFVAGILDSGEPTFLRTQLTDGTLSLTLAFPVDDELLGLLAFTDHDELGRQLDLVREDEINRLRELVRELGGDPDAR